MLNIDAIRKRFPALARDAVYFDGPAGSQVPSEVPTAIAEHMLKRNANHGGAFATSRESDAVFATVQQKTADLLGTPDRDCIAFGANMTSLAFALGRALAKTWKPNDEIIVTNLDHDANVTPWTRAAQDRGVIVKQVDIDPKDCTLDRDDFRRRLSPKTKFVALGCVSNAVGTINPVAEMVKEAHAVGALVALDAVHHAPHLPIDVTAWDCDFLLCSAYKFFGPHVGLMYGKRKHLESLPAYKVRPCAETLPYRWMTGTQNFAAIAGVGAAIDYLESLGTGINRRSKLLSAFGQIVEYERGLALKLIEALQTVPGLTIHGIVDPKRIAERVSTLSFTMAKHKPREIAEYLGSKGIYCWHGNYYALPLTERLGVEPDGMVRVGLLHYNTEAEIERLVTALRELK